jgi:hypothetical protein
LWSRSRFATVSVDSSVPASNVVGLAVPSDALTELSMSNLKPLAPRVNDASTSHAPFLRMPTVIALSSIVGRISGRKPF